MRSVNVFWFRFSVFGFWFLVFAKSAAEGNGNGTNFKGAPFPPQKKSCYRGSSSS